jgi:hypothetical protein
MRECVQAFISLLGQALATDQWARYGAGRDSEHFGNLLNAEAAEILIDAKQSRPRSSI